MTKNSELNAYPLCWGNISKDFAIDNMKKLDHMYDFWVVYDSIDADNVLDIHKFYIHSFDIHINILVIHKCLMKKCNIK